MVLAGNRNFETSANFLYIYPIPLTLSAFFFVVIPSLENLYATFSLNQCTYVRFRIVRC